VEKKISTEEVILIIDLLGSAMGVETGGREEECQKGGSIDKRAGTEEERGKGRK